MTPHQQRLKSLVDRLQALTSNGEIEWKEEERSKAVHALLNSARVEIKKDKDAIGQEAVRISLFDTEGELRLTFDDTALETRDNTGDRVFYYQEMYALLESAIRAARGEEEILDAVLNELKERDIPF